MLRGVVFDFDGVIVDSHAVHLQAWKKFLDSMGLMVSDERLEFVLDGRKRDDILRHFLGELTSEELFNYGHQKEEIFRDEAAQVTTIEGLLDFLQELEAAQIVLSVASSGSRSRVEFLMQQLGLRHRFQVIVTGDEVEEGKPDPAVFLRAAERLRIDPAELIAFEDALSGVRAARAAGMRCIGIAQPQRSSLLREAGANHVVPDFRPLSYGKLKEIFSQ
jgi:beta-phosphoglucomutase